MEQNVFFAKDVQGFYKTIHNYTKFKQKIRSYESVFHVEKDENFRHPMMTKKMRMKSGSTIQKPYPSILSTQQELLQAKLHYQTSLHPQQPSTTLKGF